MTRTRFSSLRRFVRRDDGTAAVEFALVVPLMLLLYVGTFEVSSAITLSRMLQKVAGATGDLVAQADSTIKVKQVNDYFTLAGTIMGVRQANGLKQAVTAVNVDQNGRAVVAWSMQSGGAEVLSKGKEFKLPAAMVNISKGETVIVSESSALYRPLYSFVIEQPIALEGRSIFRLRFGGKLELLQQ